MNNSNLYEDGPKLKKTPIITKNTSFKHSIISY